MQTIEGAKIRNVGPICETINPNKMNFSGQNRFIPVIPYIKHFQFEKETYIQLDLGRCRGLDHTA